jgi:hypothetical protein
MWAYSVEICFSPSASKNIFAPYSHTQLLRVEGMISTAQYICKGTGHGFNISRKIKKSILIYYINNYNDIYFKTMIYL